MKDTDNCMKKTSINKFAIFLSFILQTSVALVFGGCKQSTIEPPELVADKIACKTCNMLVSETKFAAAFEDSDGNMQIFDDIGCMLTVLRSKQKLPEHIWVRDYRQDEWIEANAATFVSSQKLGTTQNYRFVALTKA